MPVLLLALHAGCGGGGTKIGPNTPPAQATNAAHSPVPEAVPEPDSSTELNSKPSTGDQAGSQLQLPNPPANSEPIGREGAFQLLSDPEQAGSVWALDLPDPENNVDRFAFVPGPRRVDSTRFVVEPGEGGVIPTGDENEASAAGAEGTETTEPGRDARLPKGFVSVPGTETNADGLPILIRCQLDGAVMALVPEGPFIQGKDGGEPNASPAHAVVLDAFYIDLREVTYEKYEKFRAAVRDTKKRIVEPARAPRDRQEPVTGVTWAEARGYATWSGRELPTEAQWEKAARGTEGFDFPWGNGPPLWDRPRTTDQLDRVGTFKGDRSPFGVYDTAGNAREWCSDWYNDRYYQQLAAESGSTAHNPTGPRGSTGGSLRVVKGGDRHWRVWIRAGIGMADRPVDVGFRCVLRLRGSDSKGQ